MKALKGTPAEGHVSYADLIALGGAYAVAVTGGPDIDVAVGVMRALHQGPKPCQNQRLAGTSDGLSLLCATQSPWCMCVR